MRIRTVKHLALSVAVLIIAVSLLLWVFRGRTRQPDSVGIRAFFSQESEFIQEIMSRGSFLIRARPAMPTVVTFVGRVQLQKDEFPILFPDFGQGSGVGGFADSYPFGAPTLEELSAESQRTSAAMWESLLNGMGFDVSEVAQRIGVDPREHDLGDYRVLAASFLGGRRKANWWSGFLLWSETRAEVIILGTLMDYDKSRFSEESDVDTPSGRVGTEDGSEPAEIHRRDYQGKHGQS